MASTEPPVLEGVDSIAHRATKTQIYGIQSARLDGYERHELGSNVSSITMMVMTEPQEQPQPAAQERAVSPTPVRRLPVLAEGSSELAPVVKVKTGHKGWKALLEGFTLQTFVADKSQQAVLQRLFKDAGIFLHSGKVDLGRIKADHIKTLSDDDMQDLATTLVNTRLKVKHFTIGLGGRPGWTTASAQAGLAASLYHQRKIARLILNEKTRWDALEVHDEAIWMVLKPLIYIGLPDFIDILHRGHTICDLLMDRALRPLAALFHVVPAGNTLDEYQCRIAIAGARIVAMFISDHEKEFKDTIRDKGSPDLETFAQRFPMRQVESSSSTTDDQDPQVEKDDGPEHKQAVKVVTKLKRTFSRQSLQAKLHRRPKVARQTPEGLVILQHAVTPEFLIMFDYYLDRYRYLELATLLAMYQGGAYLTIKWRKQKHDLIVEGTLAGITLAMSPIPPALAAVGAASIILAGPFAKAIFKSKDPARFIASYTVSMKAIQEKAILLDLNPIGPKKPHADEHKGMVEAFFTRMHIVVGRVVTGS